MNTEFEYGFWFWSHKLNGLLGALALLSEYDLNEIEIEHIKQELRGTDDEKNNWSNYFFQGRKYRIDLMFAYDREEGSDMIHIRIKTSNDLKEKLETLNLFQSMFKELELEK